MKKSSIVTTAAAIAAAAGIAVGGAALNANADTTTPSATTQTENPGQAPQGAAPSSNGNTDPSKPMRTDEKLLTGDVAAKVTAAAKAKEPGATIQRVETDSDGVYEAHMVRADGTLIIVQIDKSYAVTNVQVGMGGGGGRAPQGAPAASGTSTT